MTTIMFGIVSIAFLDITTALITLVLGLIAWAIAYMTYFKKVKESGVPILSTGVLPKKEA